MRGAAVGEIVAVDRGDDDMGRPSLAAASATRAGSSASSARGRPVRDVAEGAGAGADVAHDHEGRVLLLPAFADVGAARLLADGDELVLAHQRLGRGVARRARRLGADPVGLARDRIIGPMRLFGMARARIGFEQIEDAGHGAECYATYHSAMAQTGTTPARLGANRFRRSRRKAHLGADLGDRQHAARADEFMSPTRLRRRDKNTSAAATF